MSSDSFQQKQAQTLSAEDGSPSLKVDESESTTLVVQTPLDSTIASEAETAQDAKTELVPAAENITDAPIDSAAMQPTPKSESAVSSDLPKSDKTRRWLQQCMGFTVVAAVLALCTTNGWANLCVSVLCVFNLVWLCKESKQRLGVSTRELSPVKILLSVVIPSVFLTVIHNYRMQQDGWNELILRTFPMQNLLPLGFDAVIVLLTGLAFSLYWQFKWPWVLARRCYAIEHLDRIKAVGRIPILPLLLFWLSVNVGMLMQGFQLVWFSVAFLLIYRHVLKVSNRWASMDLPSQYAVHQAITSGELRRKNDGIVIRYRSLVGIESWLKDRLSQRSWKKAALMISFATLFFVFDGPTQLIQLVVWLFSLFHTSAGTQIGQAGSDLAHANTDAIATLINLLLYTGIILIGGYIAKPTHLQLTQKGVRFLWRHPIFRMNGRLVKWDKIDEIRLDRPKGKALSQDGHISLCNQGKALLRTKLASIPSVDDRASVLEAFENWAARTSRSADVTEVLRPPADHSYTELWLQALTAPPKRERLKPLMPGAILHDRTYQVQHELGSGGQGFAYLAVDLHNESSVVLKEYILPVFVDMDARKAAVERFQREARTLQSLDSPRIVKLIDFFIEDHRAYLVLEHIEGENLQDLIEKNGAASIEDCLALAEQMCDILEYLHNRLPPLVHRDFTPDNLILRPDGMLKLIDFNVAQESDSTFTGTIVGKHAYLPPEQFRGMACTQSDIYALGCTLFYLLVGRDPEAISVSHPARSRSEVNAKLDAMVARATALDTEKRYPSIEELRKDLDQCIEPSPDFCTTSKPEVSSDSLHELTETTDAPSQNGSANTPTDTKLPERSDDQNTKPTDQAISSAQSVAAAKDNTESNQPNSPRSNEEAL